MKIVLKWLLIALAAILAVLVFFAGIVLTMTAIFKIEPVTTSAVQGLAQFIASIASLFLIKFIILTSIYVLAFAAFTSFVGWIWPMLAGEPRKQFFTVFRETFRGLRNNNRRWEYLVAMTMVTLIIAFANPGPPLLTSGLKEMPSAVLDNSTQQSLRGGWNFFMYGENSQPLETQQPSTAVEPTWFWWQAHLLYVIATFVYFFFAFWDEFLEAMKKAGDIFRKHREERLRREAERDAAIAKQAQQAKQRQKEKGGEPTTAPSPAAAPSKGPAVLWQGIWRFVTIDLVIETLIAIARELFGDWRARRNTWAR